MYESFHFIRPLFFKHRASYLPGEQPLHWPSSDHLSPWSSSASCMEQFRSANISCDRSFFLIQAFISCLSRYAQKAIWAKSIRFAFLDLLKHFIWALQVRWQLPPICSFRLYLLLQLPYVEIEEMRLLVHCKLGSITIFSPLELLKLGILLSHPEHRTLPRKMAKYAF